MAYRGKYKYKRKYKYRGKKGRKAKALRRVVRSVVARTAEHKFRDVSMIYSTIYGGSFRAFNPLYWIPVDSSILGRTGRKIQNVKLKVRFNYLHNGVQVVTGATPWAVSRLRCLVFKHDKEWRNANENALDDITPAGLGVGTPITNTEMLLDGANNERLAQAFPNLKEITVLMDKSWTCKFTSAHGNGSNQNFPSQPGQIWGSFDVKLGNVEYQSGTATSLPKGKQIYVVFFASCVNPTPGPADDIGAISVNYGLSYNDY